MKIQTPNQNIYPQRQKNSFKSNIWTAFVIPENKMIKPSALYSLPSKFADIALAEGLIDNKDEVCAGIAAINGRQGVYLLDKTTNLYNKICGLLKNMDDNDCAKAIIEDSKKKAFVPESLDWMWNLPDEILMERTSNLLPFRAMR